MMRVLNRTRWTRRIAWVMAGCLGWIMMMPATVAAGRITTQLVLSEMINTTRLGNFPDPGYDTVQFSSHDRRSSVPGGPNWFANSDGFGREPVPNFEEVLERPNEDGIGRYLICDVQRAGAIVRTWSAAIEGTIRVYLDGSPEPVYDGPASEFLRRGMERFTLDAGIRTAIFDGTFCQRDACYFPVLFGKRCRIEWTGDIRKIHFYEVQVRRYRPGTEVESFDPKVMQSVRPLIERVARVLKDPQKEWQFRSRKQPVPIEANVRAGETVEAWSGDGPGAIECMTINVVAGDLRRALRQTLLKITFDGHQTPQVLCPLGDFFGAAPGINPFNSVPFTVEADGSMTCRFVMPFAKSCSIQLDNRSSQPIHVSGHVLPMAWSWKERDSMHFRARWRVDHELIAEGGDNARDLPFVVARGKGVYVGTAIMLLNPNPVPTPGGNWWGEGDEKIFVDDDRVPSTFGTGSEDYFNYSWSSPEIFLHPYCGQPRNDGPANRGFVVNQRWHILDSLPFAEHLGFYMELFSHERTDHFSYARIGYHYGCPGMTDDITRITNEDLRVLELPNDWQPAARGAARNSQFFQAETLSADQTDTALIPGRLWAGGQLLVWTPSARSEQLTLKIPVAEKGRYRIHITAAQMPSGARLSATWNGRPLKFRSADGAIDTRTDYRVQLRTYSTDAMDLQAGDYLMTLVPAAGDDTDRTEHPLKIGLDFVWLQKG